MFSHENKHACAVRCVLQFSPSWQRHVLREDREFDAEAFVRAADAAAEDPQVCGVVVAATAATAGLLD